MNHTSSIVTLQPRRNHSKAMSSESKSYEFYAGMTCDGCKNAITRILTKVEGVENIDANVEEKKLVVKGTASKDVIQEKLAKWSAAANKEVRFVKEL